MNVESIRTRRTGSRARFCARLAGVFALALTVGRAAVFQETFTTDPAARGWRVTGDSSLFQWNAAAGRLEVTWDSSRPNSYFHRPLGDILTRQDDFALSFEVRLESIVGGANPAKPSTFQIAVGFHQMAAATNTGFRRGTVPGTRNVVEFDYFPPADIIDATVSPVLVSSNHQFAPAFAFPLELTPGPLYQVTLRYAASNQTLVTTLTRDGIPFGPVPSVRLPGSFTDFRVDAVSVSSYSDDGDAEGSVRARGVVDNVVVTTPAPPVEAMTAAWANGQCEVRFRGRVGWNYGLWWSEDLGTWTAGAQLHQVAITNLILADPQAPAGGRRFYRIGASRP